MNDGSSTWEPEPEPCIECGEPTADLIAHWPVCQRCVDRWHDQDSRLAGTELASPPCRPSPEEEVLP